MRRTVLFLCLLMPLAARADSPFEWFMKPNGWGWSNGYHSNNNCVKTGLHSWAPIQGANMSQSYGEPWIPTCRGCSTPSNYGQPTPATPPAPEQVPAPMMRPKTPPMMGPMMNGPMKNAPPAPDQEAHRQPWMGLRY